MIDWIVDASRRDATDDFQSTVGVSRPDSSSVTWNGTEYVPATIVIYDGPGRVRSQGTNAMAVQAGDRPVTLRTYDVQLPETVLVDVDDDVEVTASRDLAAVGLKLRVIDVPKSEWVSVRTLVAVEEL